VLLLRKFKKNFCKNNAFIYLFMHPVNGGRFSRPSLNPSLEETVQIVIGIKILL